MPTTQRSAMARITIWLADGGPISARWPTTGPGRRANVRRIFIGDAPDLRGGLGFCGPVAADPAERGTIGDAGLVRHGAGLVLSGQQPLCELQLCDSVG